MLGGGDEVSKRIDLVHHSAGLPPLFAHFSAASNVRDHVDDAPVQQAQTIGREGGRHRYAIRAVAIKQQRCFAVQLSAPAIDHRQWDLCAVSSSGEEALRNIILPIET